MFLPHTHTQKLCDVIKVLAKATVVSTLQNINVSNNTLYKLNLYNVICKLFLN